MRPGLTLTAEPGQKIQFVAPAEFYDWTAPTDSTFALAARRLFIEGAIGYQDYLDLTAAFRKS